MNNRSKKEEINTDYAIAMGIPIRKEDLISGGTSLGKQELTKEAIKEKEEKLARGIK